MSEHRTIHIDGKLAEETVVLACQNCGEGEVERHIIYSNGKQCSHTYLCHDCGNEKYYPDKKHYLAARLIVQQFTSNGKIPDWNKGIPYKIPDLEPLPLAGTWRKQQVYDGYTEEGYAYQLCGTEDKIKRLFRSETLEVYMYDFWKPCKLCDTHVEKKMKPDYAEDRIYVVIKGIVKVEDRDKPDAEAFCWTNTQIFCPKCFVELNDMFVGLESNDP